VQTSRHRRLATWSAWTLAGVAALIALPATAGAATVGLPSAQLDNTNFGRVCGAPSCTFVNDRLSVGKERAPVSGTITRWRANVAEVGVGTGSVDVRLQILRRTVNEPGVVADEFKAIRETPQAATTSEGVNKFNASLRIRKGDYIGLAALGDDVEVFGLDGAQGNRELIFEPPFIPGDGATTPDTVINQERIAFNATIRD
jgi:hypothetical protein